MLRRPLFKRASLLSEKRERGRGIEREGARERGVRRAEEVEMKRTDGERRGGQVWLGDARINEKGGESLLQMYMRSKQRRSVALAHRKRGRDMQETGETDGIRAQDVIMT